MSSGVMPYLFRLSSIEYYFGFHTKSFGKSIPPFAPKRILCKKSVQKRFKNLDEQLAGTPMERFAEDYYDGILRHLDEADKYWYWIETLCTEFHPMLHNAEWYPCSNALALFSAKCFQFAHHKTPLPAPKDLSVIHVNKRDISLQILHKEGKATAKQLEEYASWLQVAKSKRSELLLFFY